MTTRDNPSIPQATPRRAIMPAWSGSVCIHLLLILLLVWLLRPVQRGLPGEPGREVGIVLKRVSSSEEFYEGEQEQQASSEQVSTADHQLSALPTEQPSLNPADALPESPAVIGPGAVEDSGATSVRNMQTGAAQSKSLQGGAARVSIYGIEGEGRYFVFVFDRSVSMDGARLASAKAQLLGSLDRLNATHQFQIIFFNNQQWIFDLTGGQKRVPFATEENKRNARQFVGRVVADGGTDCFAALSKAVLMKPDVIFFLTDADTPMSPGDIHSVSRLNKAGAAIHTIEFGIGAATGGDNFLKQIARRNDGQYAYIDTTQLEKRFDR